MPQPSEMILFSLLAISFAVMPSIRMSAAIPLMWYEYFAPPTSLFLVGVLYPLFLYPTFREIQKALKKKKAGEIACWFESYAQNTVSFEKLEQELGKGAVKKLEKFIARGYIRNIQIDREGNYIMITAPNRRVNEKIYITVTCTSCGAKNQVIKGRLSNCEYCGQRLNS